MKGDHIAYILFVGAFVLTGTCRLAGLVSDAFAVGIYIGAVVGGIAGALVDT